MRRADKEITDPSVLREILALSEICRIAVNDGEVPYIIPLNYGYYNNCLYFHSAREGKKIELLRKNNKVSFEIEYRYEIIRSLKACGWTARYRSVMGTGSIEIINNTDEIREGLDVIMKHYGGPQKEYDESSLKKVVLLKLNIETMSGKQSGDWSKD